MARLTSTGNVLALDVQVVDDGSIELRWQALARARSYQLLIIRTGAIRAYTTLQLSRESLRYRINNLSRHQRYLVSVVASGDGLPVASQWLSVTPRAGLLARPEEQERSPVAGGSVTDGIEPHLARITRFTVMPQSRRVTAYWQLTRGFIDQLALELVHRGRVAMHLALEPEVASISLDASRDARLVDGQTYALRLHTLFTGRIRHSASEVLFCPAPQGEERDANRRLPQDGLIYPCLALSPEVTVFEDEAAEVAPASGAGGLGCCNCSHPVRWEDYRLLCAQCGAEFIPNGRGDYLQVSRLRFGPCKCCLPRKILIQKAGSQELVCAHSGKEHIRTEGAAELRSSRPSRAAHRSSRPSRGAPGCDDGARDEAAQFMLIEDLPHGLCQCCRPRRPLVRQGKGVVCSRSREKHRNEQGRYVLVPSELVFDAAAIDDLLDAGLAEICATGVSRAAGR